MASKGGFFGVRHRRSLAYSATPQNKQIAFQFLIINIVDETKNRGTISVGWHTKYGV